MNYSAVVCELLQCSKTELLTRLKFFLQSKQTLIITDISDRTEATILINANKSTVLWHTLCHQQLLQHHAASFNANTNVRHFTAGVRTFRPMDISLHRRFARRRFTPWTWGETSIDVSPHVHGAKRPYMGPNVHGANCPRDELSTGRTRWFYCVEYPQNSTRLEALGYLCDCVSGRVQR